MYICFWCLCIYVSGVCVYNYVSGASIYNYVSGVGVYMLFVVCMCLMFAFCIKFVRFKNIVFVVLFCYKKFGGPFSGQPDIPEDCQISQLGSPADCQIFWSYFYP